MRQAAPFDTAHRDGPAMPGQVEVVVFGAPGCRGPAAFVFENEPAAREYATRLRHAWPGARLILAPFSGAAGTAGLDLQATG